MKSTVIDPTVVDMLPYEIAPERITPGAVATANVLYQREDGGEVGAVWEMTPGVLEGVAAEETVVILTGRATLDFADGTTVDVGPGFVGVLYAEDISRWTVHETLRKFVVSQSR
ncbi:cupin domain-containing protein [Blastococcus sp. SYSU D00695]